MSEQAPIDYEFEEDAVDLELLKRVKAAKAGLPIEPIDTGRLLPEAAQKVQGDLKDLELLSRINKEKMAGTENG